MNHLLFAMHTVLLFSAAASPAQPPALTVWGLLQSGGWVMLPLLLASVIALWLIFYCLASIRQGVVWSRDLERRLEAVFRRGDLVLLGELVRKRNEGVARVLREAIGIYQRHPAADAEAVRSVAQVVGSGIAAGLNQRILYLLDVGVIAPMLGLFGTVVGILRSFGSIAADPSPMRTMLLAGGVSQALIATAVGLIVGICSMMFYSFFRGRLQGLLTVFEERSAIWIQELILLQSSRGVEGGAKEPESGVVESA
ncbi:Biopolymer transport protein ExbB/TolQ [Methylacidimicrobium sp. AP8]|uniref:MotA/TolQ/ExbB proton channel family protein n=1 Tax=Methylacidimicrobium sp. AP8 TaxID=2730359 RepID=UPI0018BFA33F|nr:MotA/TolQ/ExbB proton channel family protein [Methylacidimicrobium sp. AP8]CAB4243073.1 Biopolymer transport protein ExbB/TolQ [Methylacidimicrobium sp. AP8]